MLNVPITFRVYGSLRSTQVLDLVLGPNQYDLDSTVYQLPGFQAYYLKDENYPVVIKEPSGILFYQRLHLESHESLKRCLLYEGEEDYELLPLENDYLFYPTEIFLQQQTLDTPFDFDQWLIKHKTLILQQIVEWKLNFGAH